jgi:hypothetical protein
MNRRGFLSLLAGATAYAATPDAARRYFIIGQPELRVIAEPPQEWRHGVSTLVHTGRGVHDSLVREEAVNLLVEWGLRHNLRPTGPVHESTGYWGTESNFCMRFYGTKTPRRDSINHAELRWLALRAMSSVVPA